MPSSLDIAIAQTCLQNPLRRAQNRALSAKFLFSQSVLTDDTKQFRSLRVIKAVATVEPHSTELEFDEREKLRRMRISKANTGKTPWNKGRKHTPETLQRIRERTKLAMQNPKIRQKLANLGHAQSKETRVKIGEGVRVGWQRRREQMIVQETCHFDWLNLVAQASRTGFAGEDELQWNSHQILSEQLQREWKESVELRKSMPRPKGSKRAPKSLEQRRKIAEAIAAKWADPDYRERVCSGLAKYHGTHVGAERRPRRRASDVTQTRRVMSTTGDAKSSAAKSQNERYWKLRKSKTPRYKDPQIKTKLEMIKNIRAQRTVAETKITEAIKRARLLIAEAKKAAKALEVAAMKSPMAKASLTETKKLIAEAIQSIESVETVSNQEKSECYTDEIEHTKVNGSSSSSSHRDQGIDLRSFGLQDIENEIFCTTTNRFEMQGGEMKGANVSKEQKLGTSAKKWLQGRLVEVTQGEF